MHNLHYLFYVYAPNIQFVTPKVIVSYRNIVKLCLFPKINNIEWFHLEHSKDRMCFENGA